MSQRRRVDPRVSFAVLVFMNIQMAISTSFLMETASVLICACCFVYSGRIAPLARWLSCYLAFALASFGLALTDESIASPFAVTLMMYRHAFPPIMFAANMIATTRVGELGCALQGMGMPPRLTVALCIALRFFPTIWREFKAVLDAMKTRGVRVGPVMLARHPVATIERMLVPIVGRLSIVADDLGNAVVARGGEASRKRTSFYILRLSPFDCFVLFGAIASLAYSLFSRMGLISWS